MNDKPTVVALREIAEGRIDASILNDVPEEVAVDDEEAEGRTPDLPATL